MLLVFFEQANPQMPWILFITLIVLGLIFWWALEKRQRKTHPVAAGLQTTITLPHEQEFELYHNVLSLCSMKSRLCMAELGIPYKSHHIDLIETGSYENIRAKLLNANPAGTVPVLVHNGHPIYESHEQIRYAARYAPKDSPILVPPERELQQEMEMWIDRSSITKDPIENIKQSAANAVVGQTLPLFCTMIEKIPYFRIFEGFLFHFDKFRPMMFTLLKLRGIQSIHKIKPVAKLILETREALFIHLAALEQQLDKSGGPWLLGQQFSLADVSWLAIFERLRQADSVDVFLQPSRYPNVTTYWQRLTARPAYTQAILNHSHPVIDHGREALVQAKADDREVRQCLEGA